MRLEISPFRVSFVFLVIAVGWLVARPALAEDGDDAASAEPTDESIRAQLDELEAAVQRLTEAEEQRELEALIQMAETEAAAPETKVVKERTPFTSSSRALQALNPEMSVTVDAGARASMTGYDTATIEDGSGFYFRVIGIHLEANLDPYSFTKMAIEVHPGEVELGEAYATWVDFLPATSLTLGKFRQQFGINNRWHAPPMDQFDRPLALTTILGDDGLNQTGVSLEWRMPAVLADAHTLTLEITNPMNDHLFTGQWVGVPTALGHLRNYWDLSQSTYFELGLTGMWGTNDPPDEAWCNTVLGGVDLTVRWTPLRLERYRGLTWRSELFAASKELADDVLFAIGGYTYLDWRLSQVLVLGARFDLTQPFAVDNEDDWDWQVVPYVTWWQSAWVRARLQYAHRQPPDADPIDSVVLQLVWSVGPHKHELY